MGAAAAIVASAIFGTIVGVSESEKARKSSKKAAKAQTEALEQLTEQAEEVEPIPLADDEAADAARRRSVSEQIRRRGRQSTILTGPTQSSPLGGS